MHQAAGETGGLMRYEKRLVFQYKTYRSVRSGMFLVDDTGLEPVTLRTSSGCSYQLS